jgi:hypothetical protein
MRKWVGAAIIFGALAALFILGSILASKSVDFIGVQFLGSPSGRGGYVTTDRVGSMAFAALVCGCVCLGCVAAAVRTRRTAAILNTERNARDADNSKWTCPHCHEENPGNFEECWKCQRARSISPSGPA